MNKEKITYDFMKNELSKIFHKRITEIRFHKDEEKMEIIFKPKRKCVKRGVSAP